MNKNGWVLFSSGFLLLFVAQVITAIIPEIHLKIHSLTEDFWDSKDLIKEIQRKKNENMELINDPGLKNLFSSFARGSLNSDDGIADIKKKLREENLEGLSTENCENQIDKFLDFLMFNYTKKLPQNKIDKFITDVSNMSDILNDEIIVFVSNNNDIYDICDNNVESSYYCNITISLINHLQQQLKLMTKPFYEISTQIDDEQEMILTLLEFKIDSGSDETTMEFIRKLIDLRIDDCLYYLKHDELFIDEKDKIKYQEIKFEEEVKYFTDRLEMVENGFKKSIKEYEQLVDLLTRDTYQGFPYLKSVYNSILKNPAALRLWHELKTEKSKRGDNFEECEQILVNQLESISVYYFNDDFPDSHDILGILLSLHNYVEKINFFRYDYYFFKKDFKNRINVCVKNDVKHCVSKNYLNSLEYKEIFLRSISRKSQKIFMDLDKLIDAKQLSEKIEKTVTPKLNECLYYKFNNL